MGPTMRAPSDTTGTALGGDGDWAVDVVIANHDHAIRRAAPFLSPKVG